MNKGTELIESQGIEYIFKEAKKKKPLLVFDQMRFGGFVHFGVYSKLAGSYKGKTLPHYHIGEWIMMLEEISVEEYEEIARDFNPNLFDAKKWVKIFKDANMDYVIITAKHHEGFAMYNSNHPYNIIDFSKFDKDIIEELADECKRQGILFGVYYSHMIDFHDKDAYRNEWCHKGYERDFDKYFYDKCMMQVEELVSNYPVDLIWFDMPKGITKKQAEELRALVKRVNNECIVGGRLGHEMSEYVSMGDNEYPSASLPFRWEAVATLNDTWGYKESDKMFKSAIDVCRLILRVIARGGKYVLNAGPKGNGEIDETTASRFLEIGNYIRKYEELFKGNGYNPLKYTIDETEIIFKDRMCYIVLFGTKEQISLYGVKGNIKRIVKYVDNKELEYFYDDSREGSIKINSRDVLPMDVIKIEFEGELEISSEIIQKPNGEIELFPYHKDEKEEQRKYIIDKALDIINYKSPNESISWHGRVREGGKFKIRLVSRSKKYNKLFNGEFYGGHKMKIEMNGNRFIFKTKEDYRYRPHDLYYYDEIITEVGNVSLESGENYKLDLTFLKYNTNAKEENPVRRIILERIK